MLDVGPQFMCMPELELDTVWKSEDDMSSENPTSSQPPSDEQQGGFQLLDLIITELKSHMTC